MHGGLRYLEQLNFSLVFGALRERDLTIKTLAPHLVGHEHFLYPLQHQWEKPYVGAGVGLYDAMATMSKRTGGAPHARYLGRKAIEREAPGLDPEVVIGGLQYPDGRMDDARHTLAVARTAAAYGAHVITYARVTGVRTGPDGRAIGVTADDGQGGGSFDVAARVAVNAAGVWAAEVQQLAGAHTFDIAPASFWTSSAHTPAALITTRAETSKSLPVRTSWAVTPVTRPSAPFRMPVTLA
jgi:glycerol-3-phosphate dehydrogenase